MGGLLGPIKLQILLACSLASSSLLHYRKTHLIVGAKHERFASLRRQNNAAADPGGAVHGGQGCRQDPEQTGFPRHPADIIW